MFTFVNKLITTLCGKFVMVEEPLPRHLALPMLAERSGWYRSWLDKA